MVELWVSRAWFQTSNAHWVGSAFFWDITQRVVVICHFRTKENIHSNICLEIESYWDRLKNYVQQQIHYICNILLKTDQIHFTLAVSSSVSTCSVRTASRQMPTLITARTNTSADGESHPVESPRAFANGFKGMKNELMKRLFFVTCSWTPYALSVPKDKNRKDWRQTVVWLYVDKYVFANIHLYEFFPCFGMGTRAWNFCKYFRFTLYTTATERVCLQYTMRLVCEWQSYRLIRRPVTGFVLKRSRGDMLPVLMSVLQLHTLMKIIIDLFFRFIAWTFSGTVIWWCPSWAAMCTVCSEVHTKHVNALCGQNFAFVGVDPGGTHGNHGQ